MWSAAASSEADAAGRPGAVVGRCGGLVSTARSEGDDRNNGEQDA
jgi:hypothetical protein